jgi:Bacterial Ig domain
MSCEWMMFIRKCNRLVCWIILAAGAIGADAQSYTINGAQKYQTIDGFGANINHRSWNGNELKPVLDTMIGQGGMTIFRVIFDNTDWVPTDNFNQTNLNAIYGSARFEKLWDLVGYLNQKGISNGVMFNFQGPGAQWMGGATLTSGYEPQWAQMISSLITYARNARHLQFYLVGPANEPNQNTLNGVGVQNSSQYVTMLDDLAQDLNSNGLTDIRFVAPDLAPTTTSWMQAMMNDPLIMSKVAKFGLHSYSGSGTGSAGVASFISSSSYPNSTFWMTEFNFACTQCYDSVYNTNNYNWANSSATAQYLLYHLANGASGGMAWEGYDSYYQLLPLSSLPNGQQAAGWSFYGLFGVDNTNAAPKTYTPRKSFYALAQISAFVPPGSRMIGVSGSESSSFMMLAFYNSTNGQVTLTGFNTGDQTSVPITLQSLPAVPSFALYYTDPNVNLSNSATYAVTGGSFTATIPSDCIFTLTGFDPTKREVTTQIAQPTNSAHYTAPAAVTLQAAAATLTGTITNVEFFVNGNDLGGVTNEPYTITWNGVGAGTYTVKAVASDSAANSNVSAGVTFTVSGAAARIMVTSAGTTMVTPTNALVAQNGRQQFTASVVDSLGISLSPQPGVAWSVSGAGTIDSNGWFTAGDTVGGPYLVMATNNGLSGSASVTVVSNLNVAPNGIGYVWYNLTSNNATAQQYEMPAVNDGDTIDSQLLIPQPWDGTTDFSGAYEAAGIIWAQPQTISSVVYINGPTSSGNGSFASGFQLQFTYDGVNWAAAGPAWTVSPAYNYNSSSSGAAQYVFSGSMVTVSGVRCVGQVNSGRNGSAVGSMTEVQAYAGVLPVLQATGGNGSGVTLSWEAYVTNCILETTTNQAAPFTWTAVTNTWQINGDDISVNVPAPAQAGYFRLRYP